MNRDWNDFKALHSNIAGAREAFEGTCETLFREINKDKQVSVSQVKVNVGDGGIDVFIGELGVEPITVIQCKFFLESFDEAQKSQIRESFNTAINSQIYKLKKWVLCIPRVIDIHEHSWWFKWKHKHLEEYSKDNSFIEIINGNELIDLLKKHNLYNQVFKIEDSLKIEAIYNAIILPKANFCEDVNPKIILFNNYSYNSELYYLERNEDKLFNKFLQINNVWVFGFSGSGKTALVNRNLIFNNIDYCYCDLSPIEIVKSEQVIEEIIFKIEEKFNLERDSEITNIIKQLTQLLCQTCKSKIVIVMDELSVKDNKVLKEIITALTNLVVYFNNTRPESSLKFVFSTLDNPRNLTDNYSKIAEYFECVDCSEWNNDLEKLFNLLCSSLNVDFSEYKIQILKSCANSPRALKSLFRKIISYDSPTSEIIKTTIEKNNSEVIR